MTPHIPASAFRVLVFLLLGCLLAPGSGLPGQQTETRPRPAVPAYLVVLASTLNIREAPALDAAVVSTASRGDVLCVERYERDWAEVRVPAGTAPDRDAARGFVSRGFVSERRVGTAELQELGCLDP